MAKAAVRQRALLSFQRTQSLSRPQGDETYPLRTVSSDDPGQDRTVSSLNEKCGQAQKLLLSLGTGPSH